jgi:hypothetical protein
MANFRDGLLQRHLYMLSDSLQNAIGQRQLVVHLPHVFKNVDGHAIRGAGIFASSSGFLPAAYLPLIERDALLGTHVYHLSLCMLGAGLFERAHSAEYPISAHLVDKVIPFPYQYDLAM